MTWEGLKAVHRWTGLDIFLIITARSYLSQEKIAMGTLPAVKSSLEASMFCDHYNYIETRLSCKHGIYVPALDGHQGPVICRPCSHISQQLNTGR